MPVVTVPAGYYDSGAPFNLVFVGKLWSEAELLSFAYDYEQATKHRKAPVLTA
jgi:Asp-tRNA(Asn)/Glu-tRNA(Gln) amidotransferase A subunit family amidase